MEIAQSWISFFILVVPCIAGSENVAAAGKFFLCNSVKLFSKTVNNCSRKIGGSDPQNEGGQLPPLPTPLVVANKHCWKNL